jgi:capsular polysaccharide biosynthesis protein
MNENRQIQTATHNVESYEDDIEFIDILRVVWKWKYLIILGAIVCGLIAAIISFNIRKIYRVGMTLKPGILRVEEQGNKVYIDSPQHIKDLIDSGTFNNDILAYLKEMKFGKLPSELNFKVTIPEGSNLVEVKYETDNINQGIKIQNHLKELLIKEYAHLVNNFKREYNIKLSLLNSEIEYLKTCIKSYGRNIKNMENRINELSRETKFIKDNTANLLSARNKLISKTPRENSILSTLIYTNIIQQNSQLLNSNQNEINNYQQKKEEELQKLEKSENEIRKKLIDIEKLQYQKDNIQNIQILQPPTQNPLPIKPRIKFNILLGSVVGLLAMFFLAFLLEYIISEHEKGKLTNGNQ